MHQPEGSNVQNPSQQQLQQSLLNQPVNPYVENYGHAMPNEQHQDDSIPPDLSSDTERVYATLKQKRKYHVLYLIVNFIVLIGYTALSVLAVIYREKIIENDGKVCLVICYPLGTTSVVVIVTAGCVFLLKFVLCLSGISAYLRSNPNMILCLKYTYLIQIIPAFLYLDILELLINAFLFWEAATLEPIFVALQEAILILDQQGIEHH